MGPRYNGRTVWAPLQLRSGMGPHYNEMVGLVGVKPGKRASVPKSIGVRWLVNELKSMHGMNGHMVSMQR